MKKLLLVIVMSMFLFGCTDTNKIDKVVTKEGVLRTKVGEEYILESNGEMTNITSNKVNLDSYLKKNIKVTGQFSGSTLYVDKIE